MIKGLSSLGIRTERYEDLVRFLNEGMGLPVDHDEADFTAFKLPDGSTVEVFGPTDQDHRHFSTGPVAGFLVDDIEGARERLEAAGAEFIGPVLSLGGDRSGVEPLPRSRRKRLRVDLRAVLSEPGSAQR